MKLKNIVLHTFTAAALLTSSCSKDFLEKIPLNRVSPETVFSSTENAYAAINGMHRRLYSQWYSSQAMGGISGNMLYMDVLGEDFVMTENANGWFIGDYRWLGHRDVNSSMLRNNYGFFYAFVANANYIIANIDEATGLETERNFIKGQAYAYRAWAYFNLVQMFGSRYDAASDNSGLGMSLVTEPNDTAVPRSSVAETYALINSDIDVAIDLLGNSVARPHKSHLNVNVAKGIKARIALTQQNYAVAAQMAAEARDGFSLMSQADYLGGFSNLGNNEWIWGIEHRDDQPTFFYSFFAYLGDFSSTNTRGNPKAINSLLYGQITNTDVRKQLWDSTGANTEFPVVDNGVRRPYMTRKFMLDSRLTSNGDLVIMRAGEMYLIEAESLASMGRDAEAADVLYNFAVSRDTEYERSINTGNALLEEILIQRRIELWAEGFRFYDLKRLNRPLNRNGANHNASLAQTFDIPAGDRRWQFLIPQREIDYTLQVVVQNPLL